MTLILFSPLNTVLHSILHLHYLHIEQFGIKRVYIVTTVLLFATRVRSASTMAPLNRTEDFLLQLSGPALHLKSRSLFDAILSLSQSLISGLPHPPAAREHPTYPFSGRLRLLCPRNNKAHVKTVNGESNPNPRNSLNSKTTSMHQAVRHGCVHIEKHNDCCHSLASWTMYNFAYTKIIKKEVLVLHTREKLPFKKRLKNI